MKVLNYLPRNMFFGPDRATSIDMCVREQSLRSAHDTLIVCDEIDKPFEGLPLRMLESGSQANKLMQVQSIVETFEPDLIVVQQHAPSAYQLAKRLKPLPVLIHRHNFEDINRLSWFKKWRHKRRYEAMKGLIFVSDTCRDSFLQHYPGIKASLHTVHNGIDCTQWRADAAQKKNTIVFVGRIEPHKNALLAAQGMARALEQLPDWTGCLIGAPTGPDVYVDEVRRIVENCDRLSLLGAQTHDFIKNHLQEARVSLICSERESFCLVAAESLAAGAAVVSTSNGALPETIGNAGLLLKRAHVDDVTEGLLTMANEYPHYVSLGYEQVLKFDLQQTVGVLDEVYRQAIR